MSQRTKIAFLSLIICTSVVGAAWLGGRSSAEAQPPPSAPDEANSNPFARLNAKARAARTHDETAVRELVDESFNVAALNDAPAGMADAIKERLTRAEMNWRRGATTGISDANVARTVNQLANKFNAPEYAHTNRYEVRLLHTALLPYLPDFIGRDNIGAQPGQTAASSINHERMSPVEAAFVTAMLLRQKQTNPDYQLTRDEQFGQWKERHRKTKRVKADKKNDGDAAAKEQEHTRRCNAITAAIGNGAAAMSPAALLNLPADVLDALGVEQ
jgi:hypothetical protein